MITLVLLPQNIAELTFGVLHLMTLVNHYVLPVIFAQLQPVLENEIVGCDANVPFSRFHDLQSLSSSVGIALVHYLANGRSPFLELGHPVRNSRERSYYQERPVVLFVLDQVTNQRYCLDRLAQTHFVRQYPVQIVVVQRHQPLKTVHLVPLQLTSL
mgnify:CR=1 FL=1